MAAPRVDIAPDKQALKAACKALIRAGGGVESDIGRTGKSKLSEYGRADNEAFMPVDVVADFEDATHGLAGHPIVTRFLARRQGFGIFKLPGTTLPTNASLHDMLGDSIRDASALHGEVVEAWRDRKIEDHEAERVRRLAIDAAEAHLRLAAILEQMVETV